MFHNRFFFQLRIIYIVIPRRDSLSQLKTVWPTSLKIVVGFVFFSSKYSGMLFLLTVVEGWVGVGGGLGAFQLRALRNTSFFYQK